jgi:hypothetical protein
MNNEINNNQQFDKLPFQQKSDQYQYSNQNESFFNLDSQPQNSFSSQIPEIPQLGNIQTQFKQPDLPEVSSKSEYSDPTQIESPSSKSPEKRTAAVSNFEVQNPKSPSTLENKKVNFSGESEIKPTGGFSSIFSNLERFLPSTIRGDESIQAAINSNSKNPSNLELQLQELRNK